MNIRLLVTGVLAVFSLACAGSAVAGTSVQVTYAAPAVVYAPPPPRPVYYAPPYYYYVPVPPPKPRVIVQPHPVRVIYGAPVVIVR